MSAALQKPRDDTRRSHAKEPRTHAIKNLHGKNVPRTFPEPCNAAAHGKRQQRNKKKPAISFSLRHFRSPKSGSYHGCLSEHDGARRIGRTIDVESRHSRLTKQRKKRGIAEMKEKKE